MGTGAVFPSPKLHNFEIGTTANIVYLTGHGMKDKSGQEVSEEIWFTRYEENVPKMKDAISKLNFDGKSLDEVHAMLDERASAVLGMQPQGKDAKVNIGTIEVKQMDPDGTEKDGGFFRPCWGSADINTDHCEEWKPLSQGGVKYTHDHAASSYKLHTADEFPFVGKGWTFDWMAWEDNNQDLDHAVGLNEFVIKPDRGTVVTWTHEVTPVDYFCTICAHGGCGDSFQHFISDDKCTNPPTSRNLRGSKNIMLV